MMQHFVIDVFRPTLLAFLGMLLVAGAGPVYAQTAESEPEDSTRSAARGEERSAREEAKEPEMEGLWLSERMMELLIERAADDAGSQFSLNDEQRGAVREKMMERWPKFLKENRSRIQPVLNEFIEMRLEMEPPEKDRVMEWAQKADPLLKDFRKQFNDGSDEFRAELNPLQRAKFEMEAFKIGLGFQFAESKMSQWSKGEYREEEFWDPPASIRRERRKQREEGTESENRPKDKIDLELDEWTKYVQDFADMYEFDDAQRGSAKSMLEELQKRARDHRNRNRDMIGKLEAKVADGEGDDEEVKQAIVEMYGPIDGMFTELQGRLEATVRAEQKAKLATMKPEDLERRRREEREKRRAEAASRRAEENAPTPVAQDPTDESQGIAPTAPSPPGER